MFKKLGLKIFNRINGGNIIEVNLDEIFHRNDFKDYRLIDFKGVNNTGKKWSEEQLNTIKWIKKNGYDPKKVGYIEVTRDMICISGTHKVLAIDHTKNPKIKIKMVKSTWWQSVFYALILKLLGY